MTVSTQQDIVPALKLSEQEIQFYNMEGYLYLPGVVSVETAAALRQETLDVLEQSGLDPAHLSKAASKSDSLRQNGEYLIGSLLDQLIHSKNMDDIANQLMGGPSTSYFPFTAVKAGGGGGSFHFHQDNQYTLHDGPSNNIWIALNPMTPENGCLGIVPRSHLHGTILAQPPVDGEDVPNIPVPKHYLPIRMNPGDAIAFTRLTVHGSGPNHTSEPRVAYALQYHRNDTKWYDKVNKQWKLLTGNPHGRSQAVSKITRRFGNEG